MDEWRLFISNNNDVDSISKVFKFTHNDLHTNNIMYVKTEKKYVCYKYKDKYYKIPTYGKYIK